MPTWCASCYYFNHAPFTHAADADFLFGIKFKAGPHYVYARVMPWWCGSATNGMFSEVAAYGSTKLDIFNEVGLNYAVISDNQGHGLWSSASMFRSGG
jgi:hypothetical protein